MGKRFEMIQNSVKTGNLIFLVKRKLGLTNSMDDRVYLEKLYEVMLGEKLNLNNPTSFNEKLQWLKLYDRNPLYTTMVDKYLVKEYVANIIGQEYVVPILGVWDDFDKIDFSQLPSKFVLKCTHDSAGLYICRDKESMDEEAVKKKITTCLEKEFFYIGREWPYKNVEPRIIAETYLEDSKLKELRDYKFFCFDGSPKILYITQGRASGQETYADFFDMDFNHIELEIDHKMSTCLPAKPHNFELMKELAAKLSKDIPQVRIDFYEVNEKVFFGEMTFFHCGGFSSFTPNEWGETFGSWINLSK